MNKKIKKYLRLFIHWLTEVRERLRLKNLKSETFIKNFSSVFVMAIPSLYVFYTLRKSLTGKVFFVGIFYLLGTLLFLKTREQYLKDYQKMSKIKKKLIISKAMNDLSNGYLSEIIAVIGLLVTVYSSIKNPSYDFMAAFVLVFYFYLGLRMVQIAKERMYLDFIANDYEDDKKDVSIFIINNIYYKK